jgi:hypothetical protein
MRSCSGSIRASWATTPLLSASHPLLVRADARVAPHGAKIASRTGDIGNIRHARLDRVIGGNKLAVNDCPVEPGNDNQAPISQFPGSKFQRLWDRARGRRGDVDAGWYKSRQPDPH